MKLAVASGAVADGALPGLLGVAAARGAGLVVLPERVMGEAPDLSDGDGPRRLAGLARDAGVALLGGYVERCVTGTYNAAQLVDRRGVVIANYRQTHVARGERGRWADGQWLTMMPLDGVMVGLLVGHDIEPPEPARALAVAGCGVLAVAGGASDGDAAVLLPARARENGIWLAWSGADPAIYGPDGRRHGIESDGLIVADLDPPPMAGVGRPAWLRQRRPALYGELTVRFDEEGARPE
ncbi:MAG: nitrilase-related carbon-nitrogen hydrolase [Geminicoccaceae bacterium]